MVRLIHGDEIDWFIIQTPTRKKDGKSVSAEVVCNHVSELLKTKNIYLTFDDTNGIGTISYLAEQALHGTGWTLGTVDVFLEKDGVTEKVRSLNSSGKSGAYELITKICNLFEAVPIFHGDSRTVDLRAANNRMQEWEFVVGKNLKTLSTKFDSSDIVTRLYVEGEYGDYGYVGIDDVNPTGLSYLMNFDYYKDIGLFTQRHQDALDDYLTNVLDAATNVRTIMARLNTIANRLNNAWGQIKYVVYRLENGAVASYVLGGGATDEDAELKSTDSIVIIQANDKYRQGAPNFNTTDQAAVKYVTPASASIGAKEVSVSAKQQAISTWQERIDDTDSEEKIAEYRANIQTLQNEINELYDGTASMAGLYELVLHAAQDAFLYDETNTELNAAQMGQADVESDFLDAMGDMLKDGYWSDSNYVPGQEEALYQDALDMSERLAKPKVTYSLGYIAAEEQLGVSLDDLEVNDAGHIWDDELRINDYGYINSITQVFDNESAGSVEVTNVDAAVTGVTLQSVLSRITNAANIMEQKKAMYDRAEAINSMGHITASRLEGTIDVMRNQLLSVSSNWYTDAHGNLIFENAAGTAAMMLSGEGFMIADGKKQDGSWNWRTFGTGKGFAAEEITTGFLSAERIEAGSISVDKINSSFGSQIDLSQNGAITLLSGKVAKSVTSSYDLFAKNTSSSTAPDDQATWSQVAPTLGVDEFLWKKTHLIYNDNSTADSAPSCVSSGQGKDGTSNFIHVRYSANSDGSNMTQTPAADTLYIGVAITNNNTAPAAASSYTWSRYVGADGASGQDGVSSYVHIRYSASSTGANMTTQPQSNSKYIGLATTNSSTAPSTASGYTWSEYRGANGTNNYIHVMYSANSDGSDMTSTPAANTKYIGVAVTDSSTPPSTASSYTWSAYVGSNGQDGVSSYVHIRYSANSSGADMTTTPQANSKYIGIASTNSSTAPSTASGYTWSEYRGADGANGTSNFIYVRYSANADGSNMTTTPAANTKYIGVAVTESSTAPTSASAYTWSAYVGANGESSYLHIKYSANADGSQMTDQPQTNTKYLGIASTNSPIPPVLVSGYTWSEYKGFDGAAGYNNAVVYLYKRQATNPAVPTGNLTFTFGTNTLTGTLDGWSRDFPTNNGDQCWVTMANPSSQAASVTLTSNSWSTPRVLVADGEDGTGTQTYYQGTTPTSTEERELMVGDLWIDQANANVLKRWDGTSWEIVQDGNLNSIVASLRQAEISVGELGDTIMSKATKNEINDLTGTMEILQSAVEQTPELVEITFNRSIATISTLDNKYSAYIRASGRGVEIGRTNSNLKCLINNGRLSFVFDDNGTTKTVAYFGNDQLYITYAQITDELIMGRETDIHGLFKWVRTETGLGLRYVPRPENDNIENVTVHTLCDIRLTDSAGNTINGGTFVVYSDEQLTQVLKTYNGGTFAVSSDDQVYESLLPAVADQIVTLYLKQTDNSSDLVSLDTTVYPVTIKNATMYAYNAYTSKYVNEVTYEVLVNNLPSMAIVNQDDSTEATIVITWNDNGDQAQARPSSITATLNKTINGVTTAVQTVTLSASNNWTQTITSLPQHSNHTDDITYAWTEGALPTGYTLTNTSVIGTVTTMTNTYQGAGE